MAYDHLEKYNPDSLDKANQILNVLDKSDPKLTEKEDKYPFVECATLADTIKFRGGRWQSDWHFINFPYLDQGGNIDDFGDYGATPHNVTAAIEEIVDWFRNKDGYQSTYTY